MVAAGDSRLTWHKMSCFPKHLNSSFVGSISMRRDMECWLQLWWIKGGCGLRLGTRSLGWLMWMPAPGMLVDWPECHSSHGAVCPSKSLTRNLCSGSVSREDHCLNEEREANALKFDARTLNVCPHNTSLSRRFLTCIAAQMGCWRALGLWRLTAAHPNNVHCGCVPWKHNFTLPWHDQFDRPHGKIKVGKSRGVPWRVLPVCILKIAKPLRDELCVATGETRRYRRILAHKPHFLGNSERRK